MPQNMYLQLTTTEAASKLNGAYKRHNNSPTTRIFIKLFSCKSNALTYNLGTTQLTVSTLTVTTKQL